MVECFRDGRRLWDELGLTLRPTAARHAPHVSLRLAVAALVREGYGSAAELEAMPFADFLQYNATLHYDLKQQKKALQRR